MYFWRREEQRICILLAWIRRWQNRTCDEAWWWYPWGPSHRYGPELLCDVEEHDEQSDSEDDEMLFCEFDGDC